MVAQFGWWAPVDDDGDRKSEDENSDEGAESSDQLGREFWDFQNFVFFENFENFENMEDIENFKNFESLPIN